ncbi:PREDICTED: pentatricopeptide repeat-containing protein At3g02490, mitochondrial-like [Camelina sativa]|uniref:Pentatricopeptide repeat-containing protein At3g02490, mitochondrial-like n=1 Tax=Camelina sativa TaxID=90675 RepID=A0ABM0VZN0_CAMSA|nr:PREDICTED: pentatricopeptide repeat-containing protein At3g02490, mitochondrial-like [Camelina sativa]
MRYQWRLLLSRSYRLSHRLSLSHQSHQFQVVSNSTRSFSYFLHEERSGVGVLQQRQCLFALGLSSVSRSFSSEPVIEEKPPAEAVVIDVFRRLNCKDEIRKELDSNGIVISHELGLRVLRELESSPDVAGRFFQWVLEAYPRKLSSKSYNTMLRILGVNGLVREFWELVDAMKKKGHGVSAGVRDKVGERFLKDGLDGDLERLKEIFASGSMDNSVDKVCNRVCKIVMKEVWGADVEKQLRDLRLEFRSDLVKMILEKLDVDPRKGLLFFRWIDESGNFKHDEKTYNAMARVLGKEKFLDRFQHIIEEIRTAGYEMEMETYVRVSARFCQTKMIKEAVELFEFAMAGNNTPTPHCCSLLLKKIVTASKLDMDLFLRTVKAYTDKGNVVPDSMLQHVLKSLRSVDRFGQSNEVLKAMNEGGYLPSGDLQSVIASGLSRKGKKDEANELVNFMETSGNHLDDKAMASLVEGHCDAKDLEEATECFKKMIGKEGVSYAGYAFEKLVLAYCNSLRARDAYKVFTELVKQNQLKPWHSTYKIMVRNLLMKKVARDGGYEEALSLLPMMKNHGFPPFVDPFLDYLSNSGTSTEAFAFLKAVTSKKFPSNSMVLRVFEAMLKSGRHSEAQELLSMSPSYIRRNAEVLELFNSMKPDKCSLEKPVPAPAQIEA